MFIGVFPYIIAINWVSSSDIILSENSMTVVQTLYSQIQVMAETLQANHYLQYVYIPLKRGIGLLAVKKPSLFNHSHMWGSTLVVGRLDIQQPQSYIHLDKSRPIMLRLGIDSISVIMATLYMFPPI